MPIRRCAPISWGHVHQCFDARRHGVRLLATPSTCAQFLPLSDEFAIDARPPAYRRLTLLPDGTLETEVVWVDTRPEFAQRSGLMRFTRAAPVATPEHRSSAPAAPSRSFGSSISSSRCCDADRNGSSSASR